MGILLASISVPDVAANEVISRASPRADESALTSLKPIRHAAAAGAALVRDVNSGLRSDASQLGVVPFHIGTLAELGGLGRDRRGGRGNPVAGGFLHGPTACQAQRQRSDEAIARPNRAPHRHVRWSDVREALDRCD